MLCMFASRNPRMSAPSDRGEGVVAGEGLPRHKGERGALQGHRGSRKRLLSGPRRDARGRPLEGASKAARGKPEAQLKGV